MAERGKRRFPRQILRSEADMDKVDCVIVGAGVIGLAIARRLAQAGREVIVLEATEGIGTITSPAQRGDPRRHLLPRRQPDGADVRERQARALPVLPRPRHSHRNCGKLIVRRRQRNEAAVDPAHAEANGVDDLQLLTGGAARALEPALNCDAALLSPSTGIIDSHAYMLALRGDAEEAGAAYAFTRRCCTPGPAPAESKSKPAATHR